MTVLAQSFTLSTGATIPAIGFGTWQVPDGPAAYDAVAAALAAGYRHIDTARAYGNEASVGRAIADSGLARHEVFITTKLPAEIKDYPTAVASFRDSLAALGTDHVDLYLIHAPWPWEAMGSDCADGNAEVWRAFEEFFEAGSARAIGVSNFSVDDLQKLAPASRLAPAVNQISFFIGRTQDETLSYCRDHDILVEGYSPLATGAILESPEIAAIAEKYGRSVAQVCIRYVLQKGVLPLPKSTTPSRIVENVDLGFEISGDDMTRLDGLADIS